MFLIDFFHTFIPHSAALTIGPVTIWWYGIGYVVGILFGLLLSFLIVRKKNLGADLLWDLAFWLVLSGLIGARLWYVLVIDPSYYLAHPARIIKIWEGGMAIHGVLVFGVIALILWCRSRRQKFWQWADVASPAVLLGQIIGRFGNWANQELYGFPTNLPFGIPIEEAHRISGYESFAYFHPTFLYEAFLNIILLIVLLILHGRKRFNSGTIALIYIAGYGIIRALIDPLRLDPVLMVGNVRITTIVSVLIVIITLIYSAWRYAGNRKYIR